MSTPTDIVLDDTLRPPVDRAKLIGIINKYSNLSPLVKMSASIYISTVSQTQLDELAGIIVQIIKLPPDKRAELLRKIIDKIELPADLKGMLTNYAAHITQE